MHNVFPRLTTRLVRPSAVLLVLTALLLLWQGVGTLEDVSDLDLGASLFLLSLAVLYGVAGFMTWRRDRLGAWLAVVPIGLLVIVGLRWGRLPPVEVTLALLIGPALALSAWSHMNGSVMNRSRGHLTFVIAPAALIALLLVAPLWHCHVGFGGLVDYHCHSVLVHEHVH